MEYVMNETGKHSGCDCKFVAPKHTSYIGQIIKVARYLLYIIIEYSPGCHCPQSSSSGVFE